jgi:hypothetical protein
VSDTPWRRVTRAQPCPVCGRGDWCLVAADGGAAICPRTESPRRAGEAGWLHRLDGLPRTGRVFRRVRVTRVRVTVATRPDTDLGRLAAEYRDALDPGRLRQLADALGLTPASLAALGVGWSAGHGAYSFPMADAGGRVVGIRLRRPSGAKFAVSGSRAGLHVPAGPPFRPGGRLLVAEGPTDCAALLDTGFAGVVGRYSCLGDLRLLTDLARRWRPGEAVVVADADGPGRRGADALASALLPYCPAVRVVEPPGGAKDARDFVRAGGTRADLEAVIEAAPMRRLLVVFGRAGR